MHRVWGAYSFKLFQISLTEKISSRTSKEREGGLSLPGESIYIANVIYMYILKFPKNVTIKMTFFGDNFCFGSTGV